MQDSPENEKTKEDEKDSNWIKRLAKTHIFGGSNEQASNSQAELLMLQSILSDMELLSDFAQYLRFPPSNLSELDLYLLLQFYVTVESFSSSQSQQDQSDEEFQQDLLTVYKNFFESMEITTTLFKNSDPETLSVLQALVKKSPPYSHLDRGIFMVLKQALVVVFRLNFWDGFKKSSYFSSCQEKIEMKRQESERKSKELEQARGPSMEGTPSSLYGVRVSISDATEDFQAPGNPNVRKSHMFAKPTLSFFVSVERIDGLGYLIFRQWRMV